MGNPQFIEEKPLALADVKATLHSIEKRDKELGYLSTKAKEYVDLFVSLPEKKKEELHKKLASLDLTRLKGEHLCKIIDFLPKDLDELKVILQSYPLSLAKKDQEAIVAVVKEFADS